MTLDNDLRKNETFEKMFRFLFKAFLSAAFLIMAGYIVKIYILGL